MQIPSHTHTYTHTHIHTRIIYRALDFPGVSVVKNLPINAGDSGSVPGLGRSPGEGNDNPLQCSYLENAMDSGS